MRQLIRSHAWRLEIVPAAAFGVAVWSVYVFYTRVSGHCGLLAAGAELHRLCHPTWHAGIILALWLLGADMNHRWTSREGGKAMGSLVVVLHGIMIAKAWLVYTLVSSLLWLMKPTGAWPWGSLWKLALLLVIGVGTSTVLLLTQRPIPTEEAPEAPPPEPARAGSGGSVRYTETQVEWAFLAAIAILPVISVAAYLEGESIAIPLVGVAGAAVVASLARRSVTVTSECIALSAGIIRKKFRINDIESCRPAWHHLFEKRDGKRVRALLVTTGRCVEMTMKDGRVYWLGAVRPAYICSLIEAGRKLDV